jgi:hypothetical protein
MFIWYTTLDESESFLVTGHVKVIGTPNVDVRTKSNFELELELELIQTRMIQKPLLWVEVGKSACVLVGICDQSLSPRFRWPGGDVGFVLLGSYMRQKAVEGRCACCSC